MSRNHYPLLERDLSDRKKRTPANARLSTLIGLRNAYDLDVPTLIADALRDAGVVVEYDPDEHDTGEDSEPE